MTANRDKLTSDVSQAGLQVQEAKDGLAAAQKELATAQFERDRVISERSQAEQAVRKLAADRDGATSAVEALQRKQADAQAQ